MGMATELVPENVKALANELLDAMLPLSHEQRCTVLGYLSACTRKPRVFRRWEVWGVAIGTVDGGKHESWTAAVRFAKQWHANMFQGRTSLW